MAMDSCLYPEFDREVSISNYGHQLNDNVVTSGSIFLKQTKATQAALLTGIIQISDPDFINDIFNGYEKDIATVENIFDAQPGEADFGVWTIDHAIFAPVLDGMANGRMIGMVSGQLTGTYNGNSVDIRLFSGLGPLTDSDLSTVVIPLDAMITILNDRPS